jgi:hypothetical protein
MQLKALFAIDQYCATPIVGIDAFTVSEGGKNTSGEDTWVQKISMTLQSRISKLERIYQAELNHRDKDKGLDHDSLTADHLIRIWAGGADDWVCRRMENVIEHCEGITADAKTRLQQKLKILQTGNTEEVLFVIAARRDTQSGLGRESNLLAAISQGTSVVKAIAKHGLERGRRDWGGFARWLEERNSGRMAAIPWQRNFRTRFRHECSLPTAHYQGAPDIGPTPVICRNAAKYE